MAKNKGHENLIYGDKLSQEQARENGRKGGIASAKAKAEKKRFSALLDELLAKGICTPEDLALAGEFDLKDQVTQKHLVVCGLLKEAKKGNVSAAKQLLEISQEDEHLKLEKERLKIDKAYLKMKQSGDQSSLDKLDELLSKFMDGD